MLLRVVIKAELKLPFLSIGVDDVRTIFKWSRRQAGPFVVINRAAGQALDTAFGNESGNGVITWAPHGLLHQMWLLKPSGTRGEVLIVSAANGLALDATTETSGDIHPVMWKAHGEPWQRWLLEDTPDGGAYTIKSAHGRKFLTLSDAAENGWQPWFDNWKGGLSQQWILALPYGKPLQ
jgi:Ricin-type beta-trefoil lectin domain-like